MAKHKHIWREAHWKYYPPGGGVGENVTEEMWWAMFLGITIITYECTNGDCRSKKQDILKGKVECSS